MEEQDIVAIFRRELEVHEKHERDVLKEIAKEAASEAIMQTFRLIGIKMNEDGMESARTDFTFLHNLRVAQERTKGIFFKTAFHMLVAGSILFLGTALWEKVISIVQESGGTP